MENKQVLSDYEVKREQQRVKLSLQKSTQKLIDKVGIVAASAIIGAIAEHMVIDDNSINLGDVSGFQKWKELAVSGERVVASVPSCKGFLNLNWFLDHIGEFEFDAKLGGQYRYQHFPDAPEFESYSSPEFESYARSKMGVRWYAHGCDQNGVYLDKKIEIDGWDKLVIHVTNN